MDIRALTPAYSVSPQIAPQDCATLAEAGFTDVICNRPDAEIPSDLQAATMQQSAEAAGLTFHILPLTHQTMTPENVARQRSIIEGAAGPVLAYCASGTRSSVVWALGQAGQQPVEAILAAAAEAGYDLAALRPALTAAAGQ